MGAAWTRSTEGKVVDREKSVMEGFLNRPSAYFLRKLCFTVLNRFAISLGNYVSDGPEPIMGDPFCTLGFILWFDPLHCP